MNNPGPLSGPSGGPHMMNIGTPQSATMTPGASLDRNRVQLHTYIYEYFLKNQQYELARLLSESMPVNLKASPKHSPRSKEINGDGLDTDPNDVMAGKPKDLPLPEIINSTDDASSFLFGWWCQFWDCFLAARGKGSNQTKQYLNHVQQQARMNNERQRAMLNPQMQMNTRNQMMQNGGIMTNEMKKAAAMQAGRPFTAQQVRTQQQMMQQQAQMQREGSSIDMNGSAEGQSPVNGEMIPSPKRQRLNDGSFGFGPTNGQMGPTGRGQPQGMPGQHMRPISQVELNKRLISQGIDPNSLTEAQMNNLRAQSQDAQSKNAAFANGMRPQMAGMENPAGAGMSAAGPQGSPGVDANAYNGMRAMAGTPGPAKNTNGNHALQDYQMQLMLLEQQNKKRLLMARQEQEIVTNGQGGIGAHGAVGGPNQQGFAPPMSPTGSRAGRSPSASDEMKHGGTPQMAHMGMPQVGGDISQSFGSPNGSFDAGQMQAGMPPNMYSQMAKMGGQMMGPQGQPMGATSHPGFGMQMNGPINPQQMEALRRQQQAAGGALNGAFGPSQPNGMMQMGMPGQPAPNMTPQQRNAAMPPPPAPVQGENASATKTTPSSPQPFNAAPPTPQPAKAAKVKKEPAKKKQTAANKKAAAGTAAGSTTSATAATPAASDAGEPTQAATPGPPPPITPNTNGQPGNAKPTAAGTAAVPAGPAPSAPMSQPATTAQSSAGDIAPSFSGLEGTEYDTMNLDFNRVMDGPDVLDNFDFDSFLNNDANADASFAFDVNMGYDESAAGAAGVGAVAATGPSAGANTASGTGAMEASTLTDV